VNAFILAPVKINLALHVGPPLPSGYHPVDTLCVFPGFGDVIGYDPDGDPGLDLGGPFASELAGSDHRSNLIWRAFTLLDIAPVGRFFLSKETPVASGIGAGTSDGVAAMLLLNDVLDLGFRPDQLLRRSLGLGADGPVCMAGQLHAGGLLRARGIGERTEHLRRIEPEAIVLANPRIAVPTGEVFRRFDAAVPGPLTSTKTRGSLSELVGSNGNDLQRPAKHLAPQIAELLAAMRAEPGCGAAAMSGSGATCFALHASNTSAERARNRIRARGFWAESAQLLAG
jgi:4-diphosphocytidyl-2-C-methyl-D-erythritol kinase